MPKPKTLSERRKALDLSQQAVAVLANCSVTRVGQIEREAHDPNPSAGSVRAQIAEALAKVEAERHPAPRPVPDTFREYAGDGALSGSGLEQADDHLPEAA